MVCDHDQVQNYIDYFYVPKGLLDIRLVFNGSSCGLNDATWSSKFWLPMASTMVRLLHFNYAVVDIDLGEMFLNFPIHESLQDSVGIDLTPFCKQLQELGLDLGLGEKKNKRIAAKWNRLCFGLNQSPEHAVTFYYIAEEFVRGNHLDTSNPLYWDEVILNLIGNIEFNPALPNAYKWDSVLKRIAGDLIAYVDDLRAIGFSLEHAWRIARWVASKLEFLGIQDAVRKRRIEQRTMGWWKI